MTTRLLMAQRLRPAGDSSPETFIEERIDGAGETFLVPYLDGYLYYSPLANVSMLLDELGASAIRTYFRKEPLAPAERRLIERLAAQGVLRAPGVEPEALARPVPDTDTRWAPTSATFSNTQKCTLRCTYCYAEGGRLEDRDIPVPVAKAAIDIIVKNATRQRVTPSISFLGEGEATASWSVFRDIIEYFKEQCRGHGFTPTISLSTNGVFAAVRLDYVAENCTHVTVSLDGVRSVNNEHRVLPNGGGSFDRVVATMKGLEARGKSYDIRSTVTVAGSSRLAEFVLFVGENLQCKSIHFEPVFDVTGMTNLKNRIEHADAQTFVDNFRHARQVAAGFGIELYYSGSSLRQRQAFCGASNASNFLVTSRGIVTSCNEVLQPSDPRAQLFQYGQWNPEAGDFVLDEAVIRRLGKLNVHEMPKCQGCMAKYNCAGDCYAKSASVSSSGDPAAAGYTERCHITRELLKDNLLIGLMSRLVGAGTGRPDEAACRL
jgi:uncharacterized protein